MSPWFAKAVVLLGSVVIIAIRAPHGQRSRGVKVVQSRKGGLEISLLILAGAAFFLPLIWVASSLLAFADYRLRLIPFVFGVVYILMGLRLFYLSHADLGTNWSITLELREQHRLVTDGVYQHIRHPMYLALLVYSIGLALVLPNWVAGPSYLVAIGLLFALRVGPEERMMLEEFGADYETYMAKSKRLVPGVW